MPPRDAMGSASSANMRTSGSFEITSFLAINITSMLSTGKNT
jgi:hypothetical protein